MLPWNKSAHPWKDAQWAWPKCGLDHLSRGIQNAEWDVSRSSSVMKPWTAVHADDWFGGELNGPFQANGTWWLSIPCHPPAKFHNLWILIGASVCGLIGNLMLFLGRRDKHCFGRWWTYPSDFKTVPKAFQNRCKLWAFCEWMETTRTGGILSSQWLPFNL